MAPIVYFSVLLLMLAASDAAAQTTREQIARGKYVFGAAAGCGCHTVAKQPLNAGGRKYDGPFGTVYSSNITPDPTTGIGKWTDEQIITATRSGRSAFPIPPWRCRSSPLRPRLQRAQPRRSNTGTKRD